MSAPIATPQLAALVASEERPKRRLPVLPVAALLETQRTLTAVERFAKLHESPEAPLHAKFYRDLIPLEKPRPGEQYAFEVDLDACTGCKACVAACHNMNGLAEGELWRTVGLLHGGTSAAPAQQTVTTSCHHCVEPACLLGCPTKAYEKDPVTGIVKHLDDQCFGCQYCTLMCPYDAPKYNRERGIVRKCDMCSDRLAHGEAPACVQACPNGAIAIRVVDHETVIASSDGGQFLPGAPTPEDTLPTTQYKTRRGLPSNLRAGDFHHTSPEHSHPPLVIMLTLTQLSVGAFVVALGAERLALAPTGSSLVQTAFAGTVALIALAASVFHLGRPLLAHRAVLGLRTSWLSREALVFGLYAQLLLLYGATLAAPWLPSFPGQQWFRAAGPALGIGAALSGLLGVFCSVMVYVATRREQWSFAQTGVKFFSTTLLLGCASVLTVGEFSRPQALDTRISLFLWAIIGIALIKLEFEAQSLTHASDRRGTPLKRMALIMRRELLSVTFTRFALLAAGGLLVPGLLLWGAVPVGAVPALALLSLLALLAGELTERYLFFRAAPASRMPGALK